MCIISYGNTAAVDPKRLPKCEVSQWTFQTLPRWDIISNPFTPCSQALQAHAGASKNGRILPVLRVVGGLDGIGWCRVVENHQISTKTEDNAKHHVDIYNKKIFTLGCHEVCVCFPTTTASMAYNLGLPCSSPESSGPPSQKLNRQTAKKQWHPNTNPIPTPQIWGAAVKASFLGFLIWEILSNPTPPKITYHPNKNPVLGSQKR